LANFSPRFEAKREPWVKIYSSDGTLKGFANRGTLSAKDAGSPRYDVKEHSV
jgi:hypothetical protein